MSKDARPEFCDVLIGLTWKESDRVLWALRHPKDKDSPAIFGLLRERIGEARLHLANVAARRELERLGGKQP